MSIKRRILIGKLTQLKVNLHESIEPHTIGELVCFNMKNTLMVGSALSDNCTNGTK